MKLNIKEPSIIKGASNNKSLEIFLKRHFPKA